jgi:hypothetical protein
VLPAAVLVALLLAVPVARVPVPVHLGLAFAEAHSQTLSSFGRHSFHHLGAQY